MRGRDSGLRRGTLDWLLLLSGEEKWASRVGGVRRRGSSSRAGGAEARRGTWKRGRERGGQSLHRRSQAIWDLAQPQGGAGGGWCPEDLRGVARGVYPQAGGCRLQWAGRANRTASLESLGPGPGPEWAAAGGGGMSRMTSDKTGSLSGWGGVWAEEVGKARPRA